jgi:SAM-dependent methyltransferase
MPRQALPHKLLKLARDTITIGAITAELQLRHSGEAGDPDVRAIVQNLLRQMVPELHGGRSGDLKQILRLVTYSLHHARSLVEDPAGRAAAAYSDVDFLDHIGEASRFVPHAINSLSENWNWRPLRSVFRRNSNILFVGAGTGLIAIEAARLWPKTRVVSLDMNPKAIERAEQNIAREVLADSGLGGRVTARREEVEEMNDKDQFDLVWLPSMFLPCDVCERALSGLARALNPNGVLLIGMFGPFPGRHGRAIADVLTLRSKGCRQITKLATEQRALKYVKTVELEAILQAAVLHKPQ